MKNIVLYTMLLMGSSGFAFGQIYKVLWTFGGPPNDGSNPVGTLVRDKAGNLYGTTKFGGSSTAPDCGCGEVFELSPNSDGTWKEAVLYNFCVGDTGFIC